jgi:hypothetical protein
MDELCQHRHHTAADQAGEDYLKFREIHDRNSVLNRSWRQDTRPLLQSMQCRPNGR